MSFIAVNITGDASLVLSDSETRLLWLFFAGISLALCAFLAGLFSKAMAYSAAIFDYLFKKTDRMSLPVMGASILSGTLLHGLICAIVGLNSMAYVFFAAPVPYIARFIGNASRTLFNTAELAYPPSIVISSVLIYTTALILACVTGYVHGYKRHYAHIKEINPSL